MLKLKRKWLRERKRSDLRPMKCTFLTTVPKRFGGES